jgi:hypothetical protein
MSFDWSYVITNVIIGAITLVIGLILGYVGKKSFWRSVVTLSKWVRNSMMSFDLIAIRTYLPAKTEGLNRSATDRLRALYQDLKIMNITESTIIFQVPVFGNLKLVLDRIEDINEIDGDRPSAIPRIVKIKLSLRTESPINLGAKDVNELKKFVDYADKAFTAVEMFCFDKPPTIKEDYTILDTERVTRFRPEDKFDIDDKKVGARVRGTQDKIEMMIAPSTKIVEATKKYRYS